MASYIVTANAQADLRSIQQYLSSQSDTAWGLLSKRLRSAFRRLAEHPGMGHVRTEVRGRSCQVFGVGAYLVVYEPTSQPLAIVRVLHGARDLEGLFGD